MIAAVESADRRAARGSARGAGGRRPLASATASSRSLEAELDAAAARPRARTFTSWPSARSRASSVGRAERPPAVRVDRARRGARFSAGHAQPRARVARSRGPTSRRRAPSRARRAALVVVLGASRSARPCPSLSSPRLDQLERLVGKVEQADQVGDADAAAADAAAELLLGEAEVVDQRRAGARLLDRVEVLARHVLDQRELEPLRVGLVAHDRRHVSSPASCAARQRRSPATSS